MTGECDQIRERIANFVGVALPESEVQAVQEHLGRCTACREYAEALRQEDRLLVGLVEGFEGTMASRQDVIIRALSELDEYSNGRTAAVLRALVESALLKRVAAVAAIIVVALYFIITLNWVSEINELYALSM
jgi:anti-sigma factor RsiW